MDTWIIVVVCVLAVLPLIFSMIANHKNQKQMQDQMKQREDYLQSLKVGDEVLMLSGIHGKIMSIKDNVVELKISSQVNIYIEKDSIMGKTKELLFK